MLVKIGEKFETVIRKILPDPLVIAIILTVIVGGLALVLTPSNPLDVIQYWSGGFWTLIAFTMQVAFGLVAGAALAQSPIVKKGMRKFCSIPNSATTATIMLAVATLLLWFANWGIGLIAGAFLAKEMAVQLSKKGVKYHLPVLAAGGYSGILTYESGLTGAIPLQIAAAGHKFEAEMGVVPLTETLFGSFNIISIVALLIIVPVTLYLLTPKDSAKLITIDEAIIRAEEEALARESVKEEKVAPKSFAERVEGMKIWSIIIGLAGIVYGVNFFAKNGLTGVDLNVFNLIILCVGMLLWGEPMKYVAEFKTQTAQAAGVIMQFPFYAGIMGIMTSSGLVPIIANWFASGASETSIYALSFLSAGFINFFVPSGGGQWAVQGPVMVAVGQQLGANLPKIAMAVAYGDAWTNLATPFWALPIASVLGIKVRDFLGYTVVLTIVSGIFYVIALTVL